jgi:hypothetical protein
MYVAPIEEGDDCGSTNRMSRWHCGPIYWHDALEQTMQTGSTIVLFELWATLDVVVHF